MGDQKRMQLDMLECRIAWSLGKHAVCACLWSVVVAVYGWVSLGMYGTGKAEGIISRMDDG